MQSQHKPVSGAPSAPPGLVPGVAGSALEVVVNRIIASVEPCKEAEAQRISIAKFVSWVVRESIGAIALPIGSFPLRSYLPSCKCCSSLSSPTS